MVKQIHGHEVMHLMAGTGKNYTRETLREEIINTFGAETRFYTCSAENMTPEELITFLEWKGKFKSAVNGFTADTDKLCDH